MPFTKSQLISFFITAEVSSVFSIIGSILILFILLRSPNKLSTPYRRMMFMMSIMNLLYSLAWCLHTIPVPRGTTGALFAFGNTSTCNIQGMLYYFGFVGNILYNGCLCIYYVLTVRYAMSESQFRKKIEPFLHSFIALYLIGSTAVLMKKSTFNYDIRGCGVAALPLDCQLHSDIECVRGGGVRILRLFFIGFPLFITSITMIVSMVVLTRTMKKQVSKMEKYRMDIVSQNHQEGESSPPTRSRRRSIISDPRDPTSSIPTPRQSHQAEEVNQTVKQAVLYIGSFFLSYIFGIISESVKARTGELNYVCFLLMCLFTPLQGLLNFIVFIRPRIVLIRQANTEMSYSVAMRKAITSKSELTWMGRRGATRRLSVKNYDERKGYTARELHLQQQKRIGDKVEANVLMTDENQEGDDEEEENGTSHPKSPLFQTEDESDDITNASEILVAWDNQPHQEGLYDLEGSTVAQ